MPSGVARSAVCAVALLMVLLAAAAAPAAAQQIRAPGSSSAGGGLPAGLPGTPVSPNALVRPSRNDVPPPGRRRTGDAVANIADALDKVRDARREYPGSSREIFLKGVDRWQVSYFAHTKPGTPRKEIAQVQIDDRTGRVIEAWTGYQVPWSMARGYPGAFGRIVNAPWIWIPLAVLFVAPFLRPPWRMLHLDLLVLSAFSASTAFFNAARIDWSVPLVYPLLVYLLGRMLWIGLRRREPAPAHPPLRLLVPIGWLAIAVIFLVGFRVALNVTSSNVIDVGYAGVIGADRVMDGSPLYGAFPSDNASGDTYGPVVYLAYVPFEQALAWSGRWDDLPAAHAAAIAFDLLALALLFLIGRRVRGPDLGVLLAYAWATYPFTLYTLMSNSNDALVAVLVLAAVWAAGSAPARGGLVALAGFTKFAPLALAPLFATQDGWRPLRKPVLFVVGFAVATALAFAPLLGGRLDLRAFWDHTVAFQAQRGSPFSVWGLYDPDVAWLNYAQRAVQGAGALLALALAFIPRRRDIVGLAALSAAILIALQLGVSHWFYLYIPWFFGLVMIALLGRAGVIEAAKPAAAAR
jgi:hypothetical protein